MNQCTKGPVIVDYPSGHTYGRINEEAIDAILDAFEEGKSRKNTWFPDRKP